MEPLKPEERQALVDLGADPAEVLEYESLLAAQFAEDPDAEAPRSRELPAVNLVRGAGIESFELRGEPPAASLPERAARRSSLQSRLQELSQRLYPGGIHHVREEEE